MQDRSDEGKEGVWHHHAVIQKAFFLFEYLGEIETESESVLTCLSEDWMSSNHEKNNGKIFLVTLPLKGQVIAVKWAKQLYRYS